LEYGATLRYLVDGGANVAPHVCVGLHYGEIKGERIALEMAAEVKPETVVFISFIPTVGTPMSDLLPPSIETVAGLVSEAAKLCRDSEISLGCMRSRGYKDELDWKAIEAGASRIALASQSTEKRAKKAGYIIEKLEGCCATPRSFDPVLLRA
jgi:uncharacterized radical SAM superfamily protein